MPKTTATSTYQLQDACSTEDTQPANRLFSSDVAKAPKGKAVSGGAHPNYTYSWLEAIASRLEAIALRLEAIASTLEAIAIRVEAIVGRIAIRLEAIASRLEATAIRLEAGWRPSLVR